MLQELLRKEGRREGRKEGKKEGGERKRKRGRKRDRGRKNGECILYVAYSKQAVGTLSLTNPYWKQTKRMFT